MFHSNGPFLPPLPASYASSLPDPIHRWNLRYYRQYYIMRFEGYHIILQIFISWLYPHVPSETLPFSFLGNNCKTFKFVVFWGCPHLSSSALPSPHLLRNHLLIPTLQLPVQSEPVYHVQNSWTPFFITSLPSCHVILKLQSPTNLRTAHFTQLNCSSANIWQHIPLCGPQSTDTAYVSLDLSAAFDTIDHATLLSRLSTSFGVHGTALAGSHHLTLIVLKLNGLCFIQSLQLFFLVYHKAQSSILYFLFISPPYIYMIYWPIYIYDIYIYIYIYI